MQQRLEIPADVRKALAEHGLGEFFDGCTPAHQNEYLSWIGSAKKPETRAKRIGQAMEMLRKKKG